MTTPLSCDVFVFLENVTTACNNNTLCMCCVHYKLPASAQHIIMGLAVIDNVCRLHCSTQWCPLNCLPNFTLCRSSLFRMLKAQFDLMCNCLYLFWILKGTEFSFLPLLFMHYAHLILFFNILLPQ